MNFFNLTRKTVLSMHRPATWTIFLLSKRTEFHLYMHGVETKSTIIDRTINYNNNKRQEKEEEEECKLKTNSINQKNLQETTKEYKSPSTIKNDKLNNKMSLNVRV